MPTHRRPLPYLAFAAVLLALAGPRPAAAGLAETIEALVRRSPLSRATFAVSVVDETGRSVAAIADETPLIPASNMKLLTAGAALHVLGPGFRFQTRFVLDGDRLVVVGDGDPAFGDPELLGLMGDTERGGLDVEAFLDLIVDSVIDSVGPSLAEVVVDARIFDDERVHPEWPRDQLNRHYCAQVCGFNFHENVLHFFPEPRPGARPRVGGPVPAVSTLRVENRASSAVDAKATNTAWIGRKLGTNELTLYGNVRHAYKVPVPVAVDDMPGLFAQMLADRLASRGVEVRGAGRSAAPDEPSAAGLAIGPVIETPLATLTRRCLQDSENLFAEALVKRIGHAKTGQPGSWSNGLAIVRHVLHDRIGDGGLLASVRTADGSGLSRNNRVAPALLTKWVADLVADPELGPIFRECLAVGGESGTLDDRLSPAALDGAVVRAKTGYIKGVSCLTGFVEKDGRRRIFSIMFNDMAASNSQAKAVQDRIVHAIAKSMDGE